MADPAHRPVIEGAARDGGTPAGHWAVTHCKVDAFKLCVLWPSPVVAAQQDTCLKTLWEFNLDLGGRTSGPGYS